MQIERLCQDLEFRVERISARRAELAARTAELAASYKTSNTQNQNSDEEEIVIITDETETAEPEFDESLLRLEKWIFSRNSDIDTVHELTLPTLTEEEQEAVQAELDSVESILANNLQIL